MPLLFFFSQLRARFSSWSVCCGGLMRSSVLSAGTVDMVRVRWFWAVIVFLLLLSIAELRVFFKLPCLELHWLSVNTGQTETSVVQEIVVLLVSCSVSTLLVKALLVFQAVELKWHYLNVFVDTKEVSFTLHTVQRASAKYCCIFPFRLLCLVSSLNI